VCLLQDLKGTLEQELDFINEGRNSERCARDLSKFSFIYVPQVSWNLCTKVLHIPFYLYDSLVKSVNQSHNIPMEVQGGRRYSSYSFMTSALDRGEWSTSCLSCTLLPGKGPLVPTGQEAGWASEPVWTQRLEENPICLCQRSNLNHPAV
jgi:hypothetical protein